eukprot:551067_1
MSNVWVKDLKTIENKNKTDDSDEKKNSDIIPDIDHDTMIVLADILKVKNEQNSVDSIELVNQPLIHEIIRNENEYRKHIKTQPNEQGTGSNTNNNNNQQPSNSSSGNNNDQKDNNNDQKDNNNNCGNDDDDDGKDEKQNNDGINTNSDEYKADKLLQKVEKLKEHPKYQIMQQQNDALLDSELTALVYYTDSDSCCHKMKQFHRRLILVNANKWKWLYYHATNAVIKLHRVFHYKNKNKLNYKRLYHGSTISSLDGLSREQLFLKTLFSFSTQFAV